MSDFIIHNTGKKKNENIQILEAGPNPGILYALVDEGTHYNKYFDKTSRTLRLIFEFPLLKQLFMEGDTELRPTVVSQEYTFILAEKSNLKKMIDGAEGRIVQPSEYKNGWNLGKYLGRTFMVNIVNKQNKKDPSIYHNNIGGISALTDSLKAKYNFNWEEVVKSNDLVSFMIDEEGECFTSEAYQKLPNYLRKKTRESEEGHAYSARGGVFAERDSSENGNNKGNGNSNAPAPQSPTATPPKASGPIKRMISTDFSYEGYIKAGWTDAQLVEHGHMEIIEPPQPKAPKSAPAPKKPADLGLDQVDDGEVPF